MSTRPRGDNLNNQYNNHMNNDDFRGYHPYAADKNNRTIECRNVMQSYAEFSAQKQTLQGPS